MQVAQTILDQLGGNRFIAMTGARNLVTDTQQQRGSLTMKVGRNEKGVTHVRVILTDDDLYTVETIKARGLQARTLDTIRFITADALRAAFTQLTGLATSL